MTIELSWAAAWVVLITLAAVLVALQQVYRVGIKPVVKAAKGFNQRWDDAGEIEQIKSDVVDIKLALTPSNGDQRTISDRLDTIKQAAIEAKETAADAKTTFEEYKKEEMIDRRSRMREVAEEKRSLNVRIESIEGRQNDMSARQTNMEVTLKEILDTVKSETVKSEDASHG
jgi:chromosome segregation ATPase